MGNGIQTVAGALLAMVGTVVIAGWILQEPRMVRLSPGTVAMVANTAGCFALAGIALLLNARGHAPRAVRCLGGVLVAVPALILADTLFGFRFSVDWTAVHDWLADGNPKPGRMAPNTCLAFMFAGGTMVGLTDARWRDSPLSRLGVLGLLALALTGVVGFWLKTHVILNEVHVTMALPTALSMVVLSLGMWAATVRGDAAGPERAIIRASAFAVGLAVLLAGLTGFALLVGQTEAAISGWLQQKATLRVALLDEAIDEARSASEAMARDPALGQLLSGYTGPSGTSSPLLWNVRGIGIRSPSGRMESTRGVLVAAPEFAHALPGGHQLLWDRGLVVRSVHDVPGGAGTAGSKLVIDRAVARLAGQFTDDTSFGRTGEVRLCAARSATRMDCLPNWRSPRAIRDEDRFVQGLPKPMSLALSGRTGVVEAQDYREVHVLAAYAPVGSHGLGLVVKQDSFEIFQPIRERVLLALPILALLAAAGVLFIHRRVQPLANALSESERTSRRARDEQAAVMGSISDGLVIADEGGRLLFVNGAADRIFGYARGTLVGRNLRDLMPESYRAAHDAGMRRFVQHGTRRVIGRGSIELHGLRQNGGEFPLELTVDVVSHDGYHSFVGVVRDVTARQEAQRALHTEKERLRVTLHSIGDAVLTTDVQGVVTYINPAAEALLGQTHDAVVGRPASSVLELVDESTGVALTNPIQTVLATGAITGLETGTMLVRSDGARLAIEDSAAPIRAPDGSLVGTVLVFHDVTAQRALTLRISHEATHDALTDLANRRAFESALISALAHPSANTRGNVLFYIDLDQFKVVNDTCGHKAGDDLLKQVAATLRAGLRDGDLLARLGGDEFAVLLKNCPPEPGARVADQLRAAVEAIRFVHGDRTFQVGASIGMVSFDEGASIADLMAAADSACYIAKEKGRNRVHVHHATDEDVIRRVGELNWASRLTTALEKNQFVLHGQRIVQVKAGGEDVAHYEVLVRLRDDDGRLVPPMAFIPAAERYGLMPAVDRWVVRNAFALLAGARTEMLGTRISINLSGRSLSDDGFGPFVEAQFREFRIPHAQVCFEITETTAIANLVQAERVINGFKDRGCRFALDDFGSGMSSFGYLKRLRVDYIKIDGAFVRNLLSDTVDEAMVNAIHTVGSVMGLETVAEFVETDEILDRLRALGIDYAQGYGVHRPEDLAGILQ